MSATRPAPPDPEVDAYVRGHEGPLGETVGMLVGLVRATVPGCTERIHHGVPWFWVGGRAFCYVAAQTRHVNLGFRHGADLEDPDALLEGTGAHMRHVKFHGPEVVPKAKLARLLRQAAAHVPRA